MRDDFVGGSPRFRQRLLVENSDIRLEMRINAVDALEHGADEFVRRKVPTRDETSCAIQ